MCFFRREIDFSHFPTANISVQIQSDMTWQLILCICISSLIYCPFSLTMLKGDKGATRRVIRLNKTARWKRRKKNTFLQFIDDIWSTHTTTNSMSRCVRCAISLPLHVFVLCLHSHTFVLPVPVGSNSELDGTRRGNTHTLARAKYISKFPSGLVFRIQTEVYNRRHSSDHVMMFIALRRTHLLHIVALSIINDGGGEGALVCFGTFVIVAD